jgi:hypothetical protein
MRGPWWTSRSELRAQITAGRVALRAALQASANGVPYEEAKQRGRDAGEAYLRRLRADG